MFCRKGVLNNFPKFTGKGLSQGLSLFLRKIRNTLLKKRPATVIFLGVVITLCNNNYKTYNNTFPTENLWRTDSAEKQLRKYSSEVIAQRYSVFY